MKSIHGRMPVIAHPEVYDLWLGEEDASPEGLMGLLAPYATDAMEAYPISRRVNNPKADGKGLLEPIAS
jgi:putative SOS response-associated peptidase YedK